MTAVYLHLQLFVYFFQLFVDLFDSYLFTLSAVSYFRRENCYFSKTFLCGLIKDCEELGKVSLLQTKTVFLAFKVSREGG